MIRQASAWMLALLLGVATAFAQQGTTEVRGRVLDPQGAMLPGVTVTVRNQDTGMFRETVSGADGTFIVSGIVPGRYEVSAELQGFKKFVRQDVISELGKTTSLDVPLEVGAMSETVNVSADSPLVDVTSKEVGGNITGRELVDLPSINRNFIGFVGLLPGIVPSISTESFGSDSISVNGSDPRNNNYMLDGGNNNDDVIGQRAGTQARTALESVQEFQVITNQFDAQYGRTTGAIINAVTKSGTNVFHGSAFGFAQDADWTAKDYFAKERNLPKPDTQRREFGGTLGGPIIRDRAHFFGSLERVMIDRGAALVFPGRADLNWSPTTQDRVWNTLAKFDQQLSASHTWSLRYLRELSPQRNQAIGQVTPGAIREEDDKDQTVVGTFSSVFGSTKLNSLRIGWTQEDVSFGNPCFNGNGRDQAACAPTLAFQTFTDQQANTAQARVNDAYQIENTFAWFLPNRGGDHDIKLGAQYEYIEADNLAQDNLNGTFSFGQNDQPFDPANPRTYPDRLTIRVPGQGRVFEKAHYFSVFAQDKWKITHRATVTIGARYDREEIPVPERNNPDFASEDDYPIDGNNIQPRIGLSYALDQAGRRVARAGYGRFYDKTHFEIIGGLFNNGVFSDSFTVNFPTSAADSGPRNGEFPTDPFLVNGPTLNRELLNQRFPPGSTLRNAGNVTLDNPDREVPRSDQLSAGYEHQFGGTFSASVDYVHVAGRGLFMTFDENKGVRTTTAATSPIVRPDPTFQAVNTFINVGETEYDALLLQLEKRLSRGFSARVSYTLSSARGNTSSNGSGAINFQTGQELNLALNEGPSDFDRRHNLAVSGRMLVPYTHGMTFSWVARALSGLPFTLTNNSIDVDRNGTLFDPIASGSYTGAGTIAADNYSVDFEGGRNGARGPGFFQLDTRFGWRLPLGSGRTLDLSADVFNLTNRANFANPGGNQAAAATFLVLSALRDGAAPRTLQVGARLGF